MIMLGTCNPNTKASKILEQISNLLQEARNIQKTDPEQFNCTEGEILDRMIRLEDMTFPLGTIQQYRGDAIEVYNRAVKNLEEMREDFIRQIQDDFSLDKKGTGHAGNPISFKPENDGVDHINIYSKAKTRLGRFLTNFAQTPFECEDGHFDSIEGYWYWLGVDPDEPRRELLRKASGFQAKKLGRELRGKDWQDGDDFKRKIKAAIRKKLEANPDAWNALRSTDLPLDHYYVFGEGNVKRPSRGRWIVDFLEEMKEV